ncbi:MAG: ArsR/SmtB family transcription factor [Thermoplasmata archaeon]
MGTEEAWRSLCLVMHPTRSEIIEKLAEREMLLPDLERETGKSRSTISYHLDVLEREGIVESDYRVMEDWRTRGKFGKVYRAKKDILEEHLRAVQEHIERLGQKCR